MQRRLSGIPGVLYQQKERSLAIHLRLPSRTDRIARRISALLRAEGLRVLQGHRVLDGQLPGVNKGAAVTRWLRLHPGHDAVLYAGDDTTDEDAFRTLRGRAVTIAVGRRPRRAALRTRDPDSLAAWLQRLARARASRRESAILAPGSRGKRGRTP
jgi:trehalose-phosphatase